MPTSIGLRREVCRLEQANQVPDGQGGHKPGVPPWILRGLVQAREEALTNTETLLAKQLTAVLHTAWTIPLRADISVTDRLVCGARQIQLSSYQDVENKHAELRLLGAETQL